jgi:hypothetical protein
MWPFVKDTIHRAWHVALLNGSSTGISVIWLGLGGTALAFVCFVLLGWVSEGCNRQAFRDAVGSWKSYAATATALLIAWVVLFAYSTLSVVYTDHQKLIEASQKKCPTLLSPVPAPAPTPVVQHRQKARPTTRQTIIQHGNNNQSNPVVVNGKQTTNGPGSSIINGSNNNLQSQPSTTTQPQPQ